eukprot:g822.t1
MWRQSGMFRGLAARRAVLHRTLLALEQFRCNTDTQTLRASASARASVSTNASDGTLNARTGGSVHGVRRATSSVGEDDHDSVRVLLQALSRLDSSLRQVRRDASRAFPSAVASYHPGVGAGAGGAGAGNELAPQDQDVPVFSPEDSALSPPPQVAEPGLGLTFAGELSSAAASLGRRVTRARQGALAVAERAAASVPTHATTAELEQFVQLVVAVTDATDVLEICVAQAVDDDAPQDGIDVTSTSRLSNGGSGGAMLDKALQLLFSGRKPSSGTSPSATEEQQQARVALTSISAFFGDVVCTLLLHNFDVLLSRYLQAQHKAFMRPLTGALTAASVAAAAAATDLPPSADMNPDITMGAFDFD